MYYVLRKLSVRQTVFTKVLLSYPHVEITLLNIDIQANFTSYVSWKDFSGDERKGNVSHFELNCLRTGIFRIAFLESEF
jgi:hypothetical protein